MASELHVNTDRLLSAPLEPAWENLTVNDYEIVVPTQDGEVEISWLAIRTLTDTAFRSHLATIAVEQTKRIGRRIKQLRQEHQLQQEDLAALAGVSARAIEHLEDGSEGVDFTTLRRLLAAMDASLNALVVPRDTLAGK